MRVLFDIAHPAHVHFFKHILWDLEKQGHHTAVVARKKEVTRALLDHYGFPYLSAGRAKRRHILGHFCEMLRRDWVIFKLARRFRPDVILPRNPCGVQVARLVGAVGVFDSDDGVASSGIHFRAAAPFAHVITSPDCMTEAHGRKHIKYPGYKQSAYLHPSRFTPSADVLDLLGVAAGEQYFIVRFVALMASHDWGESGLDLAAKGEVIRRLRERGRVFVSSETKLRGQWAEFQMQVPPHRMHDALAFATLVVGDSQSVAAEAAYLGVPSLRVSTYAGRVCYLQELEHRYGLAWNFLPTQTGRLYAKIDELLDQGDPRAALAERHQRMLADKCDVAAWMCQALEVCAEGRRGVARRLAEASRAFAQKAT